MGMLEPVVHMTEPGVTPDVFVSGLGEVEDLGGGCFRFTFFARHKSEGGEELIVVAKLIAPMEAVPPALFLAAKAIGFSLSGSFVPRTDLN
jgi:hypothetical protein